MSTSEPNEKLLAISEKQKNEESNYVTPPKDQQSGSVYDFLYHDARRIAAFLAQFETYGVLQGVKAHESVGRTSSTKGTASANVDFATLAKGGVAINGSVTDDERDAAERTYDPLWRNANTLLDYLADREMIVRGLSDARIGQFVLVTGSLAAFDVGMLKQIWKIPAITRVMTEAAKQQDASDSSMNRHQRRGSAAKQHSKPANEVDAALELIPLLPHSVQGTIRGNDGGDWTVWFNLREESMVISSSELLLKHGIGVAGEWSALGILDALPQPENGSVEIEFLSQLIAAASLGGLMAHLGHLAAVTRTMLGRPPASFGITPLMIFREISV